jgi:N-acetylmuramoyl-L-alanine amidase
VLRLLLFLCLIWAGPALAARITALESQPGRVMISADGPLPAAQAFALDGPMRLVVDITAIVDAPVAAPGTNSVAGLRVAMNAPGTARLVIDLKAPVLIRAARAADGASGGQVVLELERVPADVFAAAVARGRRPLPLQRSAGPPPPPTLAGDAFSLPADFGRPRQPQSPPPVANAPITAPAATTPSAPPAQPPVIAPATAASPPLPQASPPAAAESAITPPQAAPTRPLRSRAGGKPLVVIDAGHGGKDVGAIAVSGGHEKDVTLAIARETARLLERRGLVLVRLTRGDDRFIPLGGRVRIARDARADLFISIHADSAPNEQARGASVYTLSAVASDAIAERLAARENKADIIGGINLSAEAPEVGDIMVDLARRATGNVSVQFADVLQQALEREDVRFRGQFHHFAAFAVLKAPDVPSVLLETGYLSNADDAGTLFSDDGRARIARGIARAIERHLAGQ